MATLVFLFFLKAWGIWVYSLCCNMFSFIAVSGLENGVKNKSCMANHRVGETGLTDSGPSSNHHHHHHNIPYAVLHGMNVPPSFMYVLFFFFLKFCCYICSCLWTMGCQFWSHRHQEGPAFDFGELEEAIVLQGVKIRNDEAKPPRMPFTPPIINLFIF